MSSERWQRMNELFLLALEKKEEERGEFLRQASEGDEELAASVDQMLRLDRQAEDFLDRPLVQPPQGEAIPRHGDEHDRQLRPGELISSYRLLRKLGEGGMSVVFLAERNDGAFTRRVVLKILRPDLASEEMLRRLHRERQILADLDHPCIARLQDGGTTGNGLPYLVMEVIDGLPIDVFCDRERCGVDERLEIFEKVAAAVRFAHQHLVVHRDLKPSNILVQPDGEPKLLDFGIAKILTPASGTTGPETATLLRALTPDFASPEQIRGQPVTTASDVYSLGVILYLLLTGRRPLRFEEKTFEAMERTLRESVPLRPADVFSAKDEADTASVSAARSASPGQLRRRLRGDLEAIVLKALRTEVRQRYTSVEQFLEDLRRFREGFPVLARRGELPYRIGKFLRRHRLASAAGAGALVAMLIFSVVVSLLSLRLERERDRSKEIQRFLEAVFTLSDPGVEGGERWTVRDALDQGASQLEDRLGNQPRTQADLLHVIGRIYTNLGLPDRAESSLARALQTRTEEFGAESLEVAETLTARSQALLGLGRPEEAEAEARSAVDLVRRRWNDRSAMLAEALNALVNILCHQSRYHEAEELSAEALGLARGGGENERLVTAQALNNRAVVMRGLGHYSRAETLYSESLDTNRQFFGQRHPLLVRLQGNLATVQRRQQRYRQAIDSYREAVRLAEEIYGADHGVLANPLSGLAVALAEAGDPAAETAFRQALEALDAHYSPSFGQTLRIYAYFAAFLLEQGRAQDAEALLLESLPLWTRKRPDGDVFLALVENTLGACATRLGRYDEAEALLLGSFEILQQKDSGRKEHARAARDRLVELYQVTERPAMAERLPDFESPPQETPAGL